MDEHGSKRSHASWIVALVVGLLVGAAAGRMAGFGGGGKRLSDLPPGSLKESDLPAGTLAGLSEHQKYTVLKGVSERFGGIARAAPQRPHEDPRAVYRVPLDDSPVKGPADALVTIVESSDFECPFCKRVLPTLKQVEDTYKGRVRFVFKHNPLPFHPKALPSALAAEEARAQGGDAKFWAMHDKLFELSPALDRANLEKAGQEVGLDLPALRSALDSGKRKDRIERDQGLARSLGATGTPTFFVNGRKIVGAVPFEAFRPVIDEELRKAEDLVREGGIPAREVYSRIMDRAATAPVMLPAVAGPQPPQAPPPAPPPAASRVPLRPDDPSKGPKFAKVTLVVFSDFQCPFCGRVEPTLRQLERAYPRDLHIVWKHQPLEFHPQAMPAAMAAEAARQQGKFWAMHELMFASQTQLSPAKYEEWARKIGLDMGRYRAALDSPRSRARIDEDRRLAASVGATGTPTAFINCRQIVGAQPYDRFKQMVDEELKRAAELAGKGVGVDGRFYDRICEENLKAAGGAVAAAPAAGPAPGAARAIPVRPDDPSKGNSKAPVTLVMFSDFQCPYCGRVEPTLKQVEKAYGPSVRIVWKHWPLPMHPQAVPAALAAEAARQQGKFWDMHQKLFQNQQALDPASLERYAREVGLDLGRFRAAVQDPKTKARIDEDLSLGQRLGATGTPTFFINGEKLVGAMPFESFKQVIDGQLQKTARR